jgi:anti-sigma B factor antagonist
MAANPVIPPAELQLDTETTPTEIVFHFVGKITSSTSTLLKSAVRGAVPEKKTIVLDLSNVSYMDSSGLGTLVSLWISAKRDGWELKIVSLSQRVKELLHLTALDKLFEISQFPDKPSF